LNKFNNVAILVIGAIFPIAVLVLGIIFQVNLKQIIGIMSLAYILGISVGPSIAYEFANPKLKIYLVAGPLGLAFIKLSMKLFASDSEVTETEIQQLKKYMSKEFGDEIGNAAEKYVKNNFQNNESTHSICTPLSKMSYSERIGVVSQLFAMAVSEREFNDEEEMLMQKIAHYLHIGKKRYNIIKSNYQKKSSYHNEQNSNYQQGNQEKRQQFLEQFFIPTYNPYIILGLENSASNEEIKKTYRELAKKYHPDVLLHKSEQIKKQSKNKFLEINEAYERIKKIRGIK